MSGIAALMAAAAIGTVSAAVSAAVNGNGDAVVLAVTL